MTKIIIDSTIDLPEQYRRQVHIVPLTIHFGTEELLDGVDIDRQRFYERLVESDVLPTTSQPSPDAFAQLFDQVEAAGDSAVVLTISHKLSGTYQSACIAAEGRERIFVVDTMSASIANVATAQITYAARNSDFDGFAINEGDYLALCDGKLMGTDRNLDVLLERLARMASDKGAEFITIYAGEGVSDEDAARAAALFETVCPQAEVSALPGGQPVYYYIVAIE